MSSAIVIKILKHFKAAQVSAAHACVTPDILLIALRLLILNLNITSSPSGFPSGGKQ